ncbi:MAG: peptidoglycan DD-metalloendopeptidase family protein [Actinobacteria bacterium]|nr:peptidoglycan DD-metalloendopeptidase family protein [Actinomycetota bacterium]MCL5887934.1 peptidoglycan DD-metalloendopeptidase family protein [Actinomycetota bacterium]
MMLCRFFSALAAVFVWASFASVQSAAGAPLQSPFEVLLGYEAFYSQGGRSVVHRGVDLSASEGDSVSAPFAGRVSFAGRVPSPGGGSRNAVTIEFGDGLRITFLPLEGITVKTGQQVSVGDSIGAVAVVAGESSPSPHLHVSVRRGEAYIDPMPFLPIPLATVAQPNDLVQEVPAQDVVKVPQTAAEPLRATVQQPVVSPQVPQTAPQTAPQTVMQPTPGPVDRSAVNGVQGARSFRLSADSGAGALAAVEQAAPTAAESGLSIIGQEINAKAPLVGATEEWSFQSATAALGSVMESTGFGAQRESDGSTVVGCAVKESAQLPISAVGVVIVAIAALIGLAPIVRGGIETSTEDSDISTGEQLAAAVGR